MTAFTLCALTLACASHPTTTPKFPTKVWWVFLERTKAPPHADEKEGERMQAAHIGNFKRLMGLHKLVAAGPLDDPHGVKRGIVVLTVKDLKAVRECFLPDPYVQGGIFILHAIPMEVKLGYFDIAAIDPLGIEENRLVVYTATPGIAAASKRDHLAYARATGIKNHLSFLATSKSDDEIREVAIFKGNDDVALQSWLAADPAIKSNTYTQTVYPQWLSKKLLPDLAENAAIRIAHDGENKSFAIGEFPDGCCTPDGI